MENKPWMILKIYFLILCHIWLNDYLKPIIQILVSFQHKSAITELFCFDSIQYFDSILSNVKKLFWKFQKIPFQQNCRPKAFRSVFRALSNIYDGALSKN